MIVLKEEEFCNPESYIDYLSNSHFHHSDKGCDIKMVIKHLGFQNEQKRPILMKECLTHKTTCHKEGWEIGWYGGTKSPKNTCECGKELEYRKKLCPECREKNKKLSLIKQEEKRRLDAEFARARRLLKGSCY